MRLLFVCTGNICRSPTAEAVMRHKAAAAGLGDRLTIDSAGTRDWNVGLPPSRLAIACAEAKGYKIRNLVARQFVVEDFAAFDRIFAMLAGLVGTVAAYFVVTRVMDNSFRFFPEPLLWTTLAACGLVLLFGGAGIWRALSAKAAVQLRNQ